MGRHACDAFGRMHGSHDDGRLRGRTETFPTPSGRFDLIQFQVALIFSTRASRSCPGRPGEMDRPFTTCSTSTRFSAFRTCCRRMWSGSPQSSPTVTISWEIAFAFLLFHPVTRAAALVLGSVAGLGMSATLELGLFGWVMIASYVAFLSPSTVSRWVSVVSPWHRRRFLHRSDREAVVA